MVCAGFFFFKKGGETDPWPLASLGSLGNIPVSYLWTKQWKRGWLYYRVCDVLCSMSTVAVRRRRKRSMSSARRRPSRSAASARRRRRVSRSGKRRRRASAAAAPAAMMCIPPARPAGSRRRGRPRLARSSNANDVDDHSGLRAVCVEQRYWRKVCNKSTTVSQAYIALHKTSQIVQFPGKSTFFGTEVTSWGMSCGLFIC